MASIFTKIVNGEIPCYKIAETPDFLAFLDIRPLHKGHTLVIPKQEVDYYFDLDEETLCGLMLFAKRVAKAIKSAIPCNRVGVAVVGDDVPHAHVHLIPFQTVRDMLFTNPPLSFSQAEMEAVAASIRERFQ